MYICLFRSNPSYEIKKGKRREHNARTHVRKAYFTHTILEVWRVSVARHAITGCNRLLRYIRKAAESQIVGSVQPQEVVVQRA